MNPLTSDVNFTPSSTALGSATDGLAGVAVASQPPQGHTGPAAVVNDHDTLPAKALPARSLT